MKINKNYLLSIGLVLAILLAPLSFNSVNAQEYTIGIGFSTAIDHTYGQAAEYFKEMVEERTDGNIQVNIYPDGQIGDDRDLQEGVEMGTIDIGVSGTPIVEMDDFFKIVDLPFLFHNRDHIAEVLDGEVGDRLGERLLQYNTKHLAYWENGFRQVTNNVRPIAEPGDLDGVLIRTPESTMRMDTFEAFGASVTAIPFGELFGALEQGIADGQENPLNNIYTGSLHEVQDYLSMTNHVYSVGDVLMNNNLYESLPEEYQQIVSEAAQEAAVFSREVGYEADNNLLGQMEGEIEILDVDEVKTAAFVEAAQPVYDELIEELGPEGEEIIREIQEMGEKYLD